MGGPDEEMDAQGEEGDADYGGYSTTKRRRIEQGIERRLEKVLWSVGDLSEGTIEGSIEAAAQLLQSDLNTYKEKIINILIDCVNVHAKMTVYSTLVGLLNAGDHVFGGEVVERLMLALRNSLRERDFDSAHNLVLFISDLVNCHVVSTHSCMAFLECLLTAVVQQNQVPQVRRDWYVYSVLCALPVVGGALMQRKPTELDKLLDEVQTYLASRKKLHVHMLRVWYSNKPLPQEDYLDCLWAQITNLRMNGWRETHLNRYYEAFSSVLAEALQHNLPNFIPPAHQSTLVYPLPRVVFRLFERSDCPDDGPRLPDYDTIERYLVERDLVKIIAGKHTERKECAAALVNYTCRTPIPLNYMVLEVVFGQLFHLPTTNHLELFYGALLIELCKLQPNSMPQVLAQAAELLYQRIDTMQPVCFDRLVNWFSYHLSNFQFRWSWDDWMDCLGCGAESQRQLFVKEVLSKVQRFTYHQRVIEIVPAGFAPLLPAKPEPNFRFANQAESEVLPGADIARQLAGSIRNRCSSDEILELLKTCPEQGDVDGCNALAIEVFTLTLLNLGSKTFSHSFAALTKYHAALKALTENNEDAQMIVLRCVYELWSSHTQMICVLVDKLLKMQIVEPGVLVSWVFSPELKNEFVRMWVWEMLQSALLKLGNHVNRLRAEIEQQEQEAIKNEEEETKPSELVEKLAAAENVQKNLLLTLFQNFTIVLTEHLLSSESEGIQLDTPWYQSVIGRLRHMFLCQHTEAAAQVENLETYLFTSDIDPHILEVFHQFCALRR